MCELEYLEAAGKGKNIRYVLKSREFIMKIDRLFAITNILIDKKFVTATELASEFGVSVRTIYRDIEILSINGIPVYTTQGKGGGISLVEGYSIDRTMLSDEEQNQVLMALGSVSATGQMDISQSLSKLRGLFKKNIDSWIEIDFTGWEQSDEEKRIFELIRNAIFSSRAIEFSYVDSNGAGSNRVVEPLKMIFKGFNWYLYGFCRLRHDYRVFKLVRMEDIRELEEKVDYKLPDNVHIGYEPVWKKEIPIDMELRLDGQMASRIYDEFRAGEIINEGDTFLVKVKMPYNEWTRGYLLGFGASLEIVEPKDLREKIASEIEKTLKKYR